MPKCAFCGTNIEKGIGKMFIYNTGKIHFFCSTKCEKNMNQLKRNPNTTKWTNYYQQNKQKGKTAQEQ